MDYKIVQDRCKHEGLSFLTITLPTYGKSLQTALDMGQVDRNLFQGFKWKGGLPRFLWGFLDRVFDRTSGVLLDDPCIESIQSLRQLTLMFEKVELPCTLERENKAFAEYIQCEKDVRESDKSLTPSEQEEFRRIASMLFWDVFKHVDQKVYMHELKPKHGPGTVADNLSSNGKYRQLTWPKRLNEVLPMVEYLIPNYSFSEYLEDVDILEPEAEIPAKVISVPKTQKTPRIIAKEPTAFQYMQQGILRELLDSLGRVDYLASMIGFDDQTPNQRMAEIGSRFGTLATLDLSEASDRVSNQHVRLLLRGHQHLFDAVDACRSRKADVPGKGIIRLAKFASMGSALCFPMEAMVFLTVVLVGIQRSLNTSLSLKDIRALQGSVRVYGDDIIIPVDHVDSVVDALQTFGFVVSISKSFWNGKFRESCGKEFYDGHDVSIVKVRQEFPTRRMHATGVISIVSLRNQLYWAGYWETVRWLDGYIRKIIKHFPNVLPSSPVLGRESALGFETQRSHEHLQIPLVRGYRVSSKIPADPLDDMGALLKYLTKQGIDPFFDEDHLKRAGRAQRVDIKLGWSSSI
jgi:hypothetical protein